MAQFNYHIGTHLTRPSSVLTNLAYTPDSTINPIILSENLETSILKTPFTGQDIHNNFYYLAISATDNTHRVTTLEGYPQVTESGNTGYVVYNGRQEGDGYFYGGGPLVIPGITTFSEPYTTIGSGGNAKAFRITAANGIVYVNGSISTTLSAFRDILCNTGTNSFTAAQLAAYINTKMLYNSKDATNTFQLVGDVDLSTIVEGTWDVTWGTDPWVNKSFYVFWDEGYAQYVNGEPLTSVFGAKVLITQKLNWNADAGIRISQLCTAIQTALNNAGHGNIFTVTAPANQYLTITSSTARTSGGIFQFTILKDTVGDGANWGYLDPTGVYSGSPPTYTYDYTRVVQCTTTGTTPDCLLHISGVNPYTAISLRPSSSGGMTDLLATFGIPTTLTTYYHTRHPLTSYNKELNYGGNFYARKIFSADNIEITGTLTTTGNATFGGILTISGTTVGTAGTFNANGSTLPTQTTRLNYEGNFYAKNVYAVTNLGLADSGGTLKGLFTTTITSADKTWTMPDRTGTVLVSGSSQATGAFDTSGSTPISSTILNYNGKFIATSFGFTSNAISAGTALTGVLNSSVYTIYLATSDIRLKREIKPLPYGLIDIMYLTPVSFFWKDGISEDRNRSIGFAAQDLKRIIPESVFGVESESSYLTVNYDYIVPVLVKAIQELALKVKSLESK